MVLGILIAFPNIRIYLMIIAFYKPYGVLSHFTSDGSANRTLAEFDFATQCFTLLRLRC